MTTHAQISHMGYANIQLYFSNSFLHFISAFWTDFRLCWLV